MNNRKQGRHFNATGAILGLFAFAWSPLAFAVDVSGPIDVDTIWFAGESPYRVTADVTVTGGATLTVEPGVTIYFEPGTNLIVSTGALRALGTATLPVTFTSPADDGAGTPAPGDWGALRFLDGADDNTTVVEHAHVRYGHGIVVESASPTLNHVTLANNAGPAINLDLNSSPVGVGLQASGNVINGILIPAGEIIGSVLWGLRGIPYVLDQGVVSVGRAPTLTLVSPGEIPQGRTVTMTVNGTRLSGIDRVAFDSPALSATVRPGATDTSFEVEVTATPEAPEGPVALEVQVVAGTVRLDNAVTIVPADPPIFVASLSPGSIRRGDSRTFEAVGENLADASVTTEAAGLTIGNVVTTETSVTFTLAADTGAVLGPQPITFTNAEGSTSVAVLVTDSITMFSIPNPLAVPPDGVQRQFVLQLAESEAVSHTFSLTVADPSVATVSPTVITFAPGQTQALVSITGLKTGETVIRAATSSISTPLEVPVFVSTSFASINFTYGRPVGVVKGDATLPPPGTPGMPTVSTVLGIAKDGDTTLPPAGTPGMPTVSTVLGIAKDGDTTLPPPGTPGMPTVSTVLGITKDGDTTLPPPGTQSGLTVSPVMGVTRTE